MIRARLGWLLAFASALAAAGALADTLRRGERLAGDPASASALPGFTVTLPGTISALATSADGRLATIVRQELVLLEPTGAIRVRRPLPGVARLVTFGAAESVAAELATGSAVLRYQELFTRAWDAAGAAVAPVALPAGGFVFARGSVVALTNGEAREVRRLQLPDGYEVAQLHVVPTDGIYAFATRGETTALVHLGWGERVTVRAVVRGKSADRRLTAAGAELALDSGSLVHVALSGAITRTDLPDDGYALTAFEHDRSVAVTKGQLVVVRRDGGRLSTSAPFGAPVAHTDAGLVVPRVLVAGDGLELWILTADGTLWRSVGTEVTSMQNTRCDGPSAAFLVASAGRVIVACQNRLVAYGGPLPSDAGFAW